MRNVGEIVAELEDTRSYAAELNDRVLELQRMLDPYWASQAMLRAKVLETFECEIGNAGKPVVVGRHGERVCRIERKWCGPADGGHSEACSRNVIEEEAWRGERRREVFSQSIELQDAQRPHLAEYRDTRGRLKIVMRALKRLQSELVLTAKSNQKKGTSEDEKSQLSLFK